jgi:hypothetical protein
MVEHLTKYFGSALLKTENGFYINATQNSLIITGGCDNRL